MNPFTTEASKEQPVTLTVPQLVDLLAPRPAGDPELTLKVAADGYLIAHVNGGTGSKSVVTGWAGQGQGKSHGRPEQWRQNYHREFTADTSAANRYTDLIAKHGGPATRADQ